MSTIDLWPDFKFDPKPRGIRQMLEEAGAGLKEKTNGLVEFRVWPVDGQHDAAFPVRYRCELHIQKLDYNYPLFGVMTAATGFPVRVLTGTAPVEFLMANDEPQLYKALEMVFQSENTKAVIQNLISMATE